MSSICSFSRARPSRGAPRRAVVPSPRTPSSSLCCRTRRASLWTPSSIRCTQPGLENTVTELRELNSANYYQFLKQEAGTDLVVVDFYTDWCGPCKVMYPELVLMQEQLRGQGVQFVKFNCSKQNKEIGKALDIRVAPTFFLYRNGEKLASMTGAKSDQLRSLIREHL